MGTIYSLPNGTQVYDNNGSTYDAHTGAVVDPSAMKNTNVAALGSGFGTPIAGEPAVLSTRSGYNNFQSSVQPKIDQANQTVAASDAQKAAAAATLAAKPPADPVPADVLAELNASKSPTQLVDENYLAGLDRQKQAAEDTAASLTLAATQAAKAQITSLTGQWQERRALLEQSNKANEANWAQQFIRFGQAEYSPGMTGDFLSLKEQEGIRAVKALDDDYNAKVAEINSALQNNNYAIAAKKTQELNDIQDKAYSVMKANATEAAAVNKGIRDTQIRASRDTAIAGLVGQGISDPTKLLDYLNYYQDGSPTGGDFTAEEIDKTLKAITVAGKDPNDLKSDLATFQYIRDNFGLPKEITSLPPQQQYFAYLKMIKTAGSTSDFTLGTNQVRFDAAGNEIARGPSGKTTSTPSDTNTNTDAPTWEEYLAAAEKAANVSYFMAPEEAQLKEQYNAAYPSGTVQKFTPTELKRLEQAGLLGATRQAQLDYLYKKTTTGAGGSATTDAVPAALQ